MDRDAAAVTWADRIAARLACLRRSPVALPTEPDLRGLGSQRRGRAILSGEIHFGGARVQLRKDAPSIWAGPAPTPAFDLARHGFDWLDDLAALSTASARDLAGRWVFDWDRRHRRGGGPGWTALATARRLARVLALGPWLSAGDAATDRRLGLMLARDARFLSGRFRAAPSPAARAETAAVLCVAAVTLEGGAGWLERAQATLEPLCRQIIDAGGGIPGRNPQVLLELFRVLALAADALADARQRPAPEHAAVLARMAPALRALRHADGQLARFQGGNGGGTVRLDAALAMSGQMPTRSRAGVMGYARLARGRSTLICDVAPPALGKRDGQGSHASTLAFELTSGRRPVIVNCGAGSGFGPDWHRAARSTPSHSTLVLEGRSSARLGIGRADRDVMVEGPQDVQADMGEANGCAVLVAGHDGYLRDFGLMHLRRLELDPLGRRLRGEDMLTAPSRADQTRFSQASTQARHSRSRGAGLDFVLRFHLHPEVSAELAGPAAILTLPNGEIWEFRHESDCMIRLDPSVYLENTLPAPLACQQIVLHGRAQSYVTQVHWSLAKSDDTPDFLRDVPEQLPAQT